MTTRIEFGSRAAANSYREDYPEHVDEDADDLRLKTVAFVDDVPDWLVERATADAASAAEARSPSGGQLPLTDGERDRIDFTKARASVPHARSVKGVMRDAGVDDWLSYYDPTLTVDEHRELAEQASRDERGRRLDAEPTEEERLAGAAKAADQQCDHARDHCEHGDEGACEFLREACGFSDDQVAEILSDETGDPSKGELPGPVYGALQKMWDQFRAGLGDAKRAAAGINEIRRQYGQDAMGFEELGDRQITKCDLDT